MLERRAARRRPRRAHTTPSDKGLEPRDTIACYIYRCFFFCEFSYSACPAGGFGLDRVQARSKHEARQSAVLLCGALRARFARVTSVRRLALTHRPTEWRAQRPGRSGLSDQTLGPRTALPPWLRVDTRSLATSPPSKSATSKLPAPTTPAQERCRARRCHKPTATYQ